MGNGCCSANKLNHQKLLEKEAAQDARDNTKPKKYVAIRRIDDDKYDDVTISPVPALSLVSASQQIMKQKPDIYVIGRNYNGELGFNRNEYQSIKELTKIGWYQTKWIKDICCGCGMNVYYNHKTQNYCICGVNENGECGINVEIQYVCKLWDINYFQKRKIKIKNIYCNIGGSAVFWIDADNKIYGHGANESYQLGIGDRKNIFEPVPIPISIGNKIQIISIKSAEKYSIALSNNGNVYYTGDLRHGNYYQKKWEELSIFNDKSIIKIETGYNHSLFLETNGSLWSGGKNISGQLGLGTFDSHSSILPEPIQYFNDNNIKIKDMKCGLEHNLVVTENNKILSWGNNQQGQCGNGRTDDIHQPTFIDSLKQYDIKIINCGSLHSYCSTFDNKHFLWGSNEYQECLVDDDDMDKVTLPNCINATVEYVTNNKTIKKVCMGWENTQIIV